MSGGQTRIRERERRAGERRAEQRRAEELRKRAERQAAATRCEAQSEQPGDDARALRNRVVM